MRQFLVRHGLSFYRQHMKGTWLGRTIGRQFIARGLVTIGDIQDMPMDIIEQPAPETKVGAFDVEAHFAVPGFHLSPPLNFAVSDGLATRPAINVLLPSLRKAHMSGGPNTALILAALLAERGERVRLIASDVATEGEEAALFDHMDGLLRRPIRRDLIEPVDGYDRRDPIKIGPDDIFLATAWWTAQIAKYAMAQTVHNAFIYLIQDFETILHEGSTFHARALETYGLNHVPVINTRLLLDHLLREGAGRYVDPEFGKRALWFEPALDRKYYFPEPSPKALGKPAKKVLLFYARPWVARRNLFELGVVALRQAVASGHIDKESWEVWAMGEKMSPVDLGNDVYLNPLPWMSFDDYARRVRTADLLLSLMLSPHPSYPPLEMAASGKLVVTNSYSVKSADRMRALSPNILVAEPNSSSIASTLGAAIGRINAGLPSHDPSGEIALPPDWDGSLHDVVDQLLLRIQEMRDKPIESHRPLAVGFPADPKSDYEQYRRNALSRRRLGGVYQQEPGLLSFITTVYNTDPKYLDELASSIFLQDGGTQFEWFILDNGSTNEATRQKLGEIARHAVVRLSRVEDNLGIVGGMRVCLEQARGRYVLPLDSDDLLERDCVNVVTRWLVENGYPEALFTDEDKLQDASFMSPYFKPNWDPVLFLHSCYIAHLCAIDREVALRLKCYSDGTAEGCHDWDSFIRLMNAGYTPLHIPEVLYSWRMHQQSTSSNIGSKSYIAKSHAATLQRALDDRKALHLRLVNSPLFNYDVDWWYRRDRIAPVSYATIAMTGKSSANADADDAIFADAPGGLRQFAEKVSALSEELVHIRWDDVIPDSDEWIWDAAGLLEMFPDAVMAGGTLHHDGRIVDGPRVFGFGLGCDCPDRGRELTNPGYFAIAWKAHSVSAVSSAHCVVRRDFLLRVIPQLLTAQVSPSMLGPWLGGLAAEQGGRVIFSPFMAAQGKIAPEERASEAQLGGFLSRFWSLLPEKRYYSPRLGLTLATAYTPVSDKARLDHLKALQRSTLPYVDWLDARLRSRSRHYPIPAAPAAISLITPVYSGSDLNLLDQLAAIIRRQTLKASQWLLVVNGFMTEAALATIRQRAGSDWNAQVIVRPEAIGIVAALHIGLDASTGDYVIPIDADDLITDDALQIIAHQIEAREKPDFLFSDEDMLIGGRPAAPYLRGPYDPLLSLDNSTIWHLCAMKREFAIAAGVYSDAAANWCQDWDSVSRVAGHGGRIEHIPEVLYHWRQHSGSTTNNAEGDARQLDSVRHILERHIARSAKPALFEVLDWPESRGARELYIARKSVDLPEFLWCDDALAEGELPCGDDAVVVFAHNGVAIQSDTVFVEVARLFDLHPDIGVLGGNVTNVGNVIVDGCYLKNGDGDLEAPWLGRSAEDGGPFALALKTQRVDLPGGALAFFRVSALKRASLWPLPRDIGRADLIWVLSDRLVADGWNVGFSPLIRGRTQVPLTVERLARSSASAAVTAPRGLVRYGLSRSFVL